MAAAAINGARPSNRGRKWLSLALRAVAVVAAGVLLAIAWRANHVWHQRAIVDHVATLDAHVVYDYGRAGIDHPPGPSWLRQLLGDDFLADVVGIEVSIPASDETLAAISALPHLKFLVLREGLDDAAMALLLDARELEQLQFASPLVTDAGLSQLARLKHLTRLSIGAPQVTDNGLLLLESLPNLSYVELIATGVTESGAGRLRAALPNCDVRIVSESPLRL
ncbi:MAG: hypothetical protein WD845_08580 [Pirellulales bacterium]